MTTDWAAVLRGATVAAIGAAVAALVAFSQTVDLGPVWTPVVMPIIGFLASVATNALRKWNEARKANAK